MGFCIETGVVYRYWYTIGYIYWFDYFRVVSMRACYTIAVCVLKNYQNVEECRLHAIVKINCQIISTKLCLHFWKRRLNAIVGSFACYTLFDNVVCMHKCKKCSSIRIIIVTNSTNMQLRSSLDHHEHLIVITLVVFIIANVVEHNLVVGVAERSGATLLLQQHTQQRW